MTEFSFGREIAFADGIAKARPNEKIGIFKFSIGGNRIITDEAKAIFDEMDADEDGVLTSAEFVASGTIKDDELAKVVIEALDSDANGVLYVPDVSEGLGTPGEKWPQDSKCRNRMSQAWRAGPRFNRTWSIRCGAESPAFADRCSPQRRSSTQRRSRQDSRHAFCFGPPV